MSDGGAKTEIELIFGFDHKAPPLEIVRGAGFVYRSGVIQHTHRPDCVDTFFDKSLWRRMLEFAETFGAVSIIDRPWGGPGTPNRDWRSGKATQPMFAEQQAVENFFESWDEELPPEIMLAWCDQKLALVIATEYWAQIGGPRPYADSYTYSIYSRDELTARILEFLRASRDADGWSVSPELLFAHDALARLPHD